MNMYSEGYVVCILKDGVPVKESRKGNVRLPEGSEFSIRLRNKNSHDACATIYIDGENVSGGGYIVRADSHIDISRHNNRDRAFKAVGFESAESIDYGKNHTLPDKAGVVKVQFYKFEERVEEHYYPAPPVIAPLPYYPKPRPEPFPEPWVRPTDRGRVRPHWNHLDDSPSYTMRAQQTSKPIEKGLVSFDSNQSCVRGQGRRLSIESHTNAALPSDEKAVVVDGSRTGQRFTSVKGNIVGRPTTITLRILIKKPAEESNLCPSCDAVKILRASYCPYCGAAYGV